MEAPSPSPSYFAHVDGLRALAVLAVLLYHLDSKLLPGGFVGVDVFFVISGFVVTASLADHRSESAGAFLSQFYARRLARLIPALVTMLLTASLLYVLFVPPAWFNRAADTVGQWAFWGLSNVALDRQVVNYFEPRAELNPFTHTWSLGVEEQFYLVVPLLLFVALGQRHTELARRRIIGGIAVLAIVSFAACLYVGVTQGPRHVFYLLVYRFWELAAGVLLFLVGKRITLPTGGPLPWMYRHSARVGLLFVLVALVLPKPQAYPYLRSMIAVVGTLLLIGLPRHTRDDPLLGAFTNSWALWIGQRSYALYLWHWPVYVLARWTTGLAVWPFNALAFALTFGLAAASYRMIENPVRHSGRLKSWSPAARICMFFGVVLIAWAAAGLVLGNQRQLGLGHTARHAADWYADGNLVSSARASQRVCTPAVQHRPLGSQAQGITIFSTEACQAVVVPPPGLFVLGDSHAVAYMPMLEQIAAEQGRTVTALHVPGCAYVNMLGPMSAAADAACHDAAKASMAEVLRRARPGDIVLLTSLRLPRLIELGGKARALAPDGRYDLGSDETQSVKAALADAPQWVRPFTEAGLQVVIELPKPIYRAHPYQCVDWFNRRNPDCAGGLTEGREAQERYRQPVVDAILELARADPGISTWDPLPALCEEKRCDAMRGDRPLYFDGDHVSPYGNLVVITGLSDMLNALPSPHR